MNLEQRIQLQKMIGNSDFIDQTELIRKLKHSVILRENINSLIDLKAEYCDDLENLKMDSMIQCGFLFTYYTDIYNKIIKDEINIEILFKFLDCLRDIEEGVEDQHSGSFKIGTLLKEIYVDSALRKAAKLNKNVDVDKEEKNNGIDISWKKFKQTSKK